VVGEGAAAWPGAGALRVPDGWMAAVSGLGGVIRASKAVEMFQRLAVKNGAVVREKTEVLDVTKQGELAIIRLQHRDLRKFIFFFLNVKKNIWSSDFVVDASSHIPVGGSILIKTKSGEAFHGAKCIVTVGAWTSKLVRSVTGADIPVQPLRTLLCYWKAKPGREGELTAEAGFPTFGSYSDPIVYGTPSLEYPGLIKVTTHGGTPCDPDARDAAADDAALVEPVARWIDAVLPGHVETAGGPVRRTACMYSMTPDEDFVIDFLGGEFGKDVVVGAGFSGHGFKMAPAVGRILAEMAMDGEAGTAAEAGVELGFFRIGRFVDNPKGNLKDSK
jgi:sarcosine oxidase / L-pipecolate oxidase